MASKRAKAAAKAAKRIPLVGTAVVVVPVLKSAATVGLSTTTFMSVDTWKRFLVDLAFNYTGYDPNSGTFDATRAFSTYGPIAAYLIARRFAGRHITRVLRPLGLRF